MKVTELQNSMQPRDDVCIMQSFRASCFLMEGL